MNCAAMQIDLSAFVDGEVEAWDALALADHLLQCPRCADFYRQARRLDSVLAQAAPQAPAGARVPAGLRIAGEPLRAATDRRRRDLLRRALPLAATILLALGAFVLWRAPSARQGEALAGNAGSEPAMTDARFVGMARDLLSAEPRYREEMLRVMLETSARRPLEATVDRRPLPARERGEAGREIGNPGS